MGPLTGGVEQALFEHEPGAEEAFFPRLEHEQHRAGQFVPPGRQQAGCSRQHGGVHVVTAGVHETGALAGEWQAGVLENGEGVHVAPEEDGRARPGAPEHRRQPAGGLVLGDVERQRFQLAEHQGAGEGKVIASLGVSMDPAAEVNRSGKERPGLRE